jgi:hypothetical protein
LRYLDTVGSSSVAVSIDLPAIHMTAAFAREMDARYALGILQSSAGRILSSVLRPVIGSDGRIDVVLLDVEIEDLELERVAIGMTGAHGVLLPSVPAPVGTATDEPSSAIA